MLADAQAPAADRRARRTARSRRARRRRRRRALIVVGEGYERWLAAHEPRDPGGRGDAGDVIVQMYTSGTTGVPKGVLTTHAQPGRPAQTSPRWAFDERSVSLTPLPMFHIGGIGWAYCGLWHGATTILVSEFDPRRRPRHARATSA